MGRPLWFVRFLQLFFPHRKILARIARIPPLSGFINEVFFDGDQMIYLPKEKVLIQQPVTSIDHVCLPSEVVHHYIDESEYCFVMNHCVCREADHCKSYPIDIGCLFLGKPVLEINPSFGRIVSKQEAHDHERKAREAGLIHLIGRYKIDSIWLGAGPAEQLITICNCCPCCCFATAIPYLEPDIDIRVKRMPEVQLTITEKCLGCGKCTQDICFVNAISIKNGRAFINNNCRGCGRCVEICPVGAIDLFISEHAVQLTISQVDRLIQVNQNK